MGNFLSKWSAFFHRIATRRNALLALAAQVLFSLVIFPAAQLRFDITGEIGVPDLHFGITPEQLYRIFEAYGPEGRKFYFWAEVFADGIYPLVYNLFSILLLSLILQRLHFENNRWYLLNLWPLLTLIFDYLENIFILQALARFPERHDTAASIASLAQCGKWITLGSGFLILMILTVLLLRRKLI